ncbi:MAG: helix-turn-helix domain-containing protein [Flavobacteriales bacterium]
MKILRKREFLKEIGITGKQLAQTLNVTENLISLNQNNKRQPRFETLIDISKALDVDIRDLFNPTKETQTETIYVERAGKFVAIGKLKR